ncbi:Ig-like domain-containing protein, partial [Lelliottia amnigena]
KDVNAVAGNLVAVSTAMNGDVSTCPAEGDCSGITNPPSGGVVETGKPSVASVKIIGADLFEGTTLTGSYVYAANGAGIDRSLYQWTRSSAPAGDPSKTIITTGVVPAYVLGSGDVGEVIWLTVKAKDDQSVSGNQVAVSTAMSDGVDCVTGADCNGIINVPGNGGLVISKPSEANSSLEATKGVAQSDGSDAGTVKATFRDAAGAAVANAPVTFTVTGSATLVAKTVNTDASGVAVAQVKDAVDETVTVGATLGGVATTPASVEVSFISALPDAAKSGLEATKDVALSDGTDAGTVTATFLDDAGAAVVNAPVTFTVTGSATLVAKTVNTDASGVAVAQVKDAVDETVTVG